MRYQAEIWKYGVGRLSVWLRMTAAAGLLLSLCGCLKEILFVSLLIHGPPSVEPDFDRMTKKSFTDAGVTVAVVCYAPKEILLNNFKVDQLLGHAVSARLHQHKIKVINPDRILAWIDRNPDWERPVEIGEAFDAAYVLSIDLTQYSLYEENSGNLYRGRAQTHLRVWEMDETADGEKIYEDTINTVYPLAAPRSTSSQTLTTFRREFLSRLSEEIGRRFYEYYNGDDIVDAT